jgi:hypothetical protein
MHDKAINTFVPTKSINQNHDPPWYNKEIKRLKRKCRSAYSRRHLSDTHKAEFNSLSKQCCTAKQQAEEFYLSKLLQKGHSTKLFYTHLKKKRRGLHSIPPLRTENGNLLTDDKAKADLLNSCYSSVFNPVIGGPIETEDAAIGSQQFPTLSFTEITIASIISKADPSKAPGPDGIGMKFLKQAPFEFSKYLYVLYSKSLCDGVLPEDWKMATVVPIFKKGEKAKPSNYRPVSLTSCVCKILEHIIGDHLKNYLESNKLLKRCQHGFRTGYSCETQLLGFYHQLVNTIDKGGQVDAVFLDFSKAFDVVSHAKLITKLNGMGISHEIIAWIRSFLSNRKQKVKIENEFSNEISVTSGVPQGSVLGPLLFLIFINDLPESVKTQIRLFADDCIVYNEICNDSDCANLQKDLNAVHSWCIANEMKLNSDKSQLIRFSRKRTPVLFDYRINDAALAEATEAKYLGALLSSNLSWGKHLDQVLAKANRAINFISRNCKGMGWKAKELAYFSLVRPHLEYAAMIWDPSQQCKIAQLERVQRKAARFVLGRYGRYDSVTSMIQGLGWNSLELRRKVARLSGLYRVYTSQEGWEEFTEILLPPVYYGRHDHAFKIREVPCKTDIKLHSFLPKSVRDWNSLPHEVFCPPPSSTNSFKSKLYSKLTV